jgi:hypothetical protein
MAIIQKNKNKSRNNFTDYRKRSKKERKKYNS